MRTSRNQPNPARAIRQQKLEVVTNIIKAYVDVDDRKARRIAGAILDDIDREIPSVPRDQYDRTRRVLEHTATELRKTREAVAA